MSDEIALASAAQLFGRLAISEIDHDLADELWEPERREALARLGLHLPDRTEGSLDRLALEYKETFANPGVHPPLVQSLCEAAEERPEGASASSVRAVREAFGLELEHSAPPDHLGAELLLWAELVEEAALARRFAARHLVWAIPHLERRAIGDGFYARLATVIADFIVVVSSR